MIHENQDVRFTVQAYANQTFVGKVRQVRLQSTTTENVVNYTVVVTVDNPKGTLLPGMTATVEFLTGSAENALIVPNAALRFRATPEMMAEAGVTNGAPRTAADSVAFAARRDSLRRVVRGRRQRRWWSVWQRPEPRGQTAGGQNAGGQSAVARTLAAKGTAARQAPVARAERHVRERPAVVTVSHSSGTSARTARRQ